MLRRHRRESPRIHQSACKTCGKLILSEEDPPPQYCPERPMYDAQGIVRDQDGVMVMVPSCEPKVNVAEAILGPSKAAEYVRLMEKQEQRWRRSPWEGVDEPPG